MSVTKIYIKSTKRIRGNSLESLGVYFVLRKYYACTIFLLKCLQCKFENKDIPKEWGAEKMEELMNELTGSSTLHYFRVLFLPGLKTSIHPNL